MVLPAQKPIIVWFRDDLRLADQPALAAAKAHGGPVLCVYVLDEVSTGLRPLGGASRWWLHHSLEQLAASLSKIGARLDLLKGASDEIIPQLAKAVGADQVVWTRRYGAAEIALDSKIKTLLKQQGVSAESFKGQLLFEPWELQTKAGGPFKVFTPFWRAALALGDGDITWTRLGRSLWQDPVLGLPQASADQARLGGRIAQVLERGRSRSARASLTIPRSGAGPLCRGA